MVHRRERLRGEEPLLTIDSPTSTDRRLVIQGTQTHGIEAADRSQKRLPTDWTSRVLERTGWPGCRSISRINPRTQLFRSLRTVGYLGFRHVSGLMSWSADAKARFIYSLVEEHDYDFDRAAKVIGSRRDTIRRNFVAWAAIEQARRVGIETEPAVLHFGVDYRALQNPRARTFLDLKGWIDGSEQSNAPLGDDGTERFGELLGYVFGPTEVIKESRELDKLALALEDESSLSILRTERDLDLALRSRPVDRAGIIGDFVAYRHAAAANAEAFHFAGYEDVINDARRLEEIAKRISTSLAIES